MKSHPIYVYHGKVSAVILWTRVSVTMNTKTDTDLVLHDVKVIKIIK